MVTAGCSGLLDHNGSPSDIPNDNTLTDISSEKAVNPNNNSSEGAEKSNQKAEYVNSGQEFAALVGEQLHRHDQTRLIASESYPNNTVNLTIQMRGERPLYWSMMDATQSIAAVTFHATVDSEELPKINGTVQRLHEPEIVTVHMVGPDEELLGTFTVGPEMARQYRLNDLSEVEFANSVSNSYRVVRKHERGSEKPSQYLNRSELTIWAQDYASEVRDWSDDMFDQPFPINNIKTNSSSHEVLHKFNWSMEKYGQAPVSASATAYTAYWRTTDHSWAMAPENLKIYIQRPDELDNYAGYMERRWVYKLLKSNRNSSNLTAYIDSEEGRYVEEGKNPFEDEF